MCWRCSETLRAVFNYLASLKKPLPAQGRYLLSGVPEGYDARVLVDALNSPCATPFHLHVARDAGRLAALDEGLAFFAPELELVVFPAWDCLPYDRVSPNPEIVAGRIDACLLYTSPSPRDATLSRMPSSA